MEVMERKVLCVDDDPWNMYLLNRLLTKIPAVRFLEADTAELGLEMALAVLPDLILMDIKLPGMDGYEALERLKLQPSTCHIPVWAISALAFDTDIARGKKAGFAEYLTKPLNIQSFVKLIRHQLRIQE